MGNYGVNPKRFPNMEMHNLPMPDRVIIFDKVGHVYHTTEHFQQEHQNTDCKS